MNETMVKKAESFARKAHKGQLRKGTDIPYITHPEAAAGIAASLTDDEAVIAAAWLHDTVEDTGVTMETLTREFGGDVAALVAANSEDKMEDRPAESTWETRKAHTIRAMEQCKDRRVKMLVFSDKLANLRALNADHQAIGDKLWERFNQKDPARHAFYYGSFLRTCAELKDTAAYGEYARLMTETFGAYGAADFTENSGA